MMIPAATDPLTCVRITNHGSRSVQTPPSGSRRVRAAKDFSDLTKGAKKRVPFTGIVLNKAFEHIQYHWCLRGSKVRRVTARGTTTLIPEIGLQRSLSAGRIVRRR